MVELGWAFEARNPARNCFRCWRIEAGRDLFGVWMVHVRYGRIGCAGRLLVRSFAGEAAARGYVRAGLARRASAPRRIGAEYRGMNVVAL